MTQAIEQPDTAEVPPRGGRRFARWWVPAGVAATVAGVAGVATLIAAGPTSTSPSLPNMSSAELVASASKARADLLSGSVRITTDLKVPGLDASAPGRLGRVNGTRTAQIAVDGEDRQRISLTDRGTTYEVVHNGATFWTYDSASRAATRSDVPADWSDRNAWERQVGSLSSYQPQELAQQLLTQFSGHADVTVAGTARVADRDVYLLRLAPKDSPVSMLVDRVLVSVDAQTNVPLRAEVFQNGQDSPAVDVRFTKVSFDRPSADAFAFTPPSGATVKRATAEANVEAFSQRLGEGVLGPLGGLS